MIAKKGWILKKSKSFGWKRRYFRLQSNKKLFYYDNESMKSAKGSIPLNGVTAKHVQHSDKASNSKHYGYDKICNT